MSYAPTPYPPAPRRSSMTVPLVVLLIVVALAGAAAAGFFAVRAASGSDPAPAQAQAPAASVPVARTTVVTPETLGGKAKAKVDTGEPFAGYARFGITAQMSAVYGNLQANDVLFVAAAIAVSKGTAQERFEQFKTELAGNDFKVENYTSVEPGLLGGLAACGDGDFNGEDSGFCVWSDDTTTGFLVQTRANGLGLANTNQFQEFREQIEKPV